MAGCRERDVIVLSAAVCKTSHNTTQHNTTQHKKSSLISLRLTFFCFVLKRRSSLQHTAIIYYCSLNLLGMLLLHLLSLSAGCT